MLDKYVQTKTFSVTVPLDALEKHIDTELRELLLKELHVDSLASVQLNTDLLNGGISFFTVQVSEV